MRGWTVKKHLGESLRETSEKLFRLRASSVDIPCSALAACPASSSGAPSVPSGPLKNARTAPLRLPVLATAQAYVACEKGPPKPYQPSKAYEAPRRYRRVGALPESPSEVTAGYSTWGSRLRVPGRSVNALRCGQAVCLAEAVAWEGIMGQAVAQGGLPRLVDLRHCLLSASSPCFLMSCAIKGPDLFLQLQHASDTLTCRGEYQGLF